MKTIIKDIAYYLPERTVTNADLFQDNPSWENFSLLDRTGVERRHIAGEGETALDLAVAACQKLFAGHEDAPARIDGIMFCTQSGDYIMPPNACVLHKRLGLPENVFAFDFNHACSGYVYGLALGQGLIAAGTAKNILFVTADTYSRYIHGKDRSARLLFGDGAAATWLTSGGSAQGIVDIQCATSGEHYDKFMIPAGGCRKPKSSETHVETVDAGGNVRSPEHIQMDGLGILFFVGSRVPAQVQDALDRNNLKVEDIDMFFFHQASKVALDSLVRLLKIPPEKAFRNLQVVGNTVSASIPIALKQAWETGKVSAGDKILLCGFGVGLSWGTAIVDL